MSGIYIFFCFLKIQDRDIRNPTKKKRGLKKISSSSNILFLQIKLETFQYETPLDSNNKLMHDNIRKKHINTDQRTPFRRLMMN
jgi:hypothetical protein